MRVAANEEWFKQNMPFGSPVAAFGAPEESFASAELLTDGEGVQAIGAAAADLVVDPPANPLGVARQFVEARYADERQRRIVHHRGLFYSWRGTHWVEQEPRAVRAELYRWLEHAVYAKSSGLVPFEPTRVKIANVVEALEALVHIREQIEAPAWLTGENDPAGIVAMQNGLLRLSTRELLPHTPAFFNRHALPFSFDPSAPSPERWQRFLHELWGEDTESIETLAELMGYVLAGGTELQKIFMLVGPKRSGKGTIGRVLAALLGPENVAAPTLSSLSTNFGLQPLVSRPLALISDARLIRRADTLIAVERLLSISGEDSITIDRKYKDPWTGRLPTRFVILTNEIPEFTDASGALASRFIILPLANSFYGRENQKLTEELLTEAPAIFNWCLEGFDRLQQRGHFVQPTAAASAIHHLEDLASPVSAFVRDHCVVGPTETVSKDDLWKTWKEWCAEEGAKTSTKNVFVRDLRAAVPSITPGRPKVGQKRLQVLHGIALRDSSTMQTIPDIPDLESSWSGMSGISTTAEPSPEEIERLLARGKELGLA